MLGGFDCSRAALSTPATLTHKRPGRTQAATSAALGCLLLCHRNRHVAAGRDQDLHGDRRDEEILVRVDGGRQIGYQESISNPEPDAADKDFFHRLRPELEHEISGYAYQHPADARATCEANALRVGVFRSVGRHLCKSSVKRKAQDSWARLGERAGRSAATRALAKIRSQNHDHWQRGNSLSLESRRRR